MGFGSYGHKMEKNSNWQPTFDKNFQKFHKNIFNMCIKHQALKKLNSAEMIEGKEKKENTKTKKEKTKTKNTLN